MNVKKQQMQLQLQQEPQRHRQDGAAGFGTLARDKPAQQLPKHDHQYRQGSPGQAANVQPETAADRESAPVSPGPASPLSLPSPYYDRNPVVGFPPYNHHHHHHHHQYHHASPKSPVAAVPLANVLNVVDQDNNPKYYYQKQHHHQVHSFNHANGSTDGRDDDKENIKQKNSECLQQLDEVLKACVDYEERNKISRQQQSSAAEPTEGSGNTSPAGTAGAPTPPYQNRIKTNGSLPRDYKKSGNSSPTSPLSPVSVMTLSPTSPSSTWPTTATSSLSSPLSLNMGGADSDSVFLENDCFPSSASNTLTTPTPPPNVTTCGSPRTRIKTLPVTSGTPTTTTTAADLFNDGSRDRSHRQYNGNGTVGDGGGANINSPNNISSSKSPERLQQRLSSASLQSNQSRLSPASFLANQSPSWQSTTTWLQRTSPFLANNSATDSGGAGTTASVVVSERAAEAAEQRRKLLVELSSYKSRLVELHLRREEIDRELIIETALLHAELDVADDETRQSDNIVDGLDRAVAECRQQMDLCTVKQQEQRTAADTQLAGHRQALQGLRSRLETIEDDDGLKTEIRASIDKQTELLETEQKLYEDVEFGLLEEEAGWLARREELHRDRAAAVAVRRARRARAEWLRAQLDQLRSVGDDQLRALRTDINTATLSIQQGHKKLLDLDSAAGLTNVHDLHYRRHPFQYENGSLSAAEQHQPLKSLEWPWDQQLKSPMSPLLSPSPSLWEQQSKSPFSPWPPNTSTGMVNNCSFSPSSMADANNANSLMTGSMTTTCCSSIASSGGEDDGRPASEDSTSRMSMSTIFDGGTGIKLRPKNKPSSPDITKRPLTRYLPVRYDDGDGATENRIAFDLRGHIESAGHQLDDDGTTDRHFWIDSLSCRGYLKKLSGTDGGKHPRRGGRKWLKRWFVFDRQSRTLAYYHRRSDEVDVAAAGHQGSTPSKKTNRPRASIRFQDIQEVYVDHTNSSKGQGCAFVVKTAQRTFYLSAATGQAVRVWVDVIFTGAEGYREYLQKGSTDDRAGNAISSSGTSGR